MRNLDKSADPPYTNSPPDLKDIQTIILSDKVPWLSATTDGMFAAGDALRIWLGPSSPGKWWGWWYQLVGVTDEGKDYVLDVRGPFNGRLNAITVGLDTYRRHMTEMRRRQGVDEA